MKRFKSGQRVMVRTVDDPNRNEKLPINAVGTVGRLLLGGSGAWIALDQRSSTAGAHPFPEDDPSGRGTHVLAYPDDCDQV